MDPKSNPTNSNNGSSTPSVPAPNNPDPLAQIQPPDPTVAPTSAPSPQAAVNAQPQPVIQQDTPLIADDVDLIEKEWVEAAKQLVDKTKSDPYTQNKEINKFKAAYIKQRYNKAIHLSKD